MRKFFAMVMAFAIAVTSAGTLAPISAGAEANEKYLLNLDFDSENDASGIIGLKPNYIWVSPGGSQLSYIQYGDDSYVRFPLKEAMNLEGTDKYEIEMRFKMPYLNYRVLALSNGNPDDSRVYWGFAQGLLSLCRYGVPGGNASDMSLDDKTGIGSATSDEWRTVTITYDNGSVKLKVIDEHESGNVENETSTTLAALTGSANFQHRPGTTYDHLLLGNLQRDEMMSVDYIRVKKTAQTDDEPVDKNSLLNLDFDSAKDASGVIGLKPSYIWVNAGESQLSYIQYGDDSYVRFPLKEAMNLEGADKYEIEMRFKMPYLNYRVLALSNGNPGAEVLAYNGFAQGFLALCRYGLPGGNASDMSLDDKTGIGSATSDEWRTVTITYDNGNVNLKVVDEHETGNVESETSTTLAALTGSDNFQHRPGTTYDHLLLWNNVRDAMMSVDYIKVTKIPAPKVNSVTVISDGTESGITADTKGFEILFNDTMDEDSLAGSVMICDADGRKVSADGTLSEDKKTYSLKLRESLAGGTEYTMKVSTAAKTMEGINLKSDYVSRFFCEDAYTLLTVNYDMAPRDIENIYGTAATVNIKEESGGNKYMSIQPNWGNSGYSLSYTMPDSDRDYAMRFDFSFEGVRTDIASVMLCEKANVRQGGENVYNQFGLVRPTEDGKFSVAGNEVAGITYEENKWYSYELNFNRSSCALQGKIYERDNPAVCADFSFVAQHGIYGNGMPDLQYDALKFGCNGTVNIDNIILHETVDKPVKCKVTSEHTGNIFGGDDEKTLEIQLDNVMHTAANVTVSYEIIDEDGRVLKSASLSPFTMNAGENKKCAVSADVTKFGTYKIIPTVRVSADGTQSYRCGAFPFSVVNKRTDGEPLNYESGANSLAYYIETQDKWDAVKEIMQQAGIGGIRTVLSWSDVQKTKDAFVNNASYANIAYSDAISSGINNMATLSMENAVLYGGWDKPNAPHKIGTEEAWAEWEAYVDYVSKTYKDSVTYWEVINEPNAFMTGAQYAEYITRAYPIIKKNDPDGLVCGFALSGREWTWLESALKAVSADCMDIITIHPYDWEFDQNEFAGLEQWSTVFRDNNYVNSMNRLKTLLAKYGFENIPVLSTEVSVSSTPPSVEHKGLSSLKAQGAELIQLYALTKKEGFINSSYWYSLICTSVRGLEDVVDGDRNGNFGLVGNEKDVVPYAAKPAYAAMAGYNKMLTNAEYVDCIENVNDWSGTRAYRFRRTDGKQVIVLWSENKAENIALNLGIDSAEIYDKYTNKIGVMKADGGVFNFTSSFEPIYIVGDFKNFERGTGTITVDIGRQEKLCGDTAEFNLADASGRNLRIETEGTKWAEVTENTGMQNGAGHLSVQLMSGARQEEPVDVSVYEGESLIYYGRLHILAGEVSLGKVKINQKEIYTIDDAASGELTIPVLINNLYKHESGAEILVSFYDAAGRLLSVQKANAGALTRGTNEIKTQITVPESCAGMKIYLWKTNGEMIPLCGNLYIQ